MVGEAPAASPSTTASIPVTTSSRTATGTQALPHATVVASVTDNGMVPSSGERPAGCACHNSSAATVLVVTKGGGP
jgi:hypothetical protein